MISVIIFSLNEEKTIDHVVRFAKKSPIVDDFVIKDTDFNLLTPIIQ